MGGDGIVMVNAFNSIFDDKYMLPN
jgi:hypothetical protein